MLVDVILLEIGRYNPTWPKWIDALLIIDLIIRVIAFLNRYGEIVKKNGRD